MLRRNVVSTLILVSLVVCMGMGTGIGCPKTTLVPSSVNIPDGYVEVAAGATTSTHFVVDATINNQGPFKFVVDTGASGSVVSPKIGALLKPSGQTINVAGTGGTLGAVPYVIVDSLVIGTMQFNDFLAVVIDVPLLASQNLDGIIGLPVFHDVTMSIHYPARKLRVSTSALSESTCNAAINGADLTSPITFTQMTTEVKLGDQAAQAIIDSGNDQFLTVPGAFAGLSFTGPLTDVMVGGVVGVQANKVGTLSGNVTVKCLTYQNPQIIVGGERFLLGALGWRSLILSIDQRAKLMRLESGGCAPNNSCNAPDALQYRVYLLDLPFGGQSGHLEVLEDGAENLGYVECNFWIAGNDCTALAVMAPITDPFPTQKAAVLSLCPRIANISDGNFGSIALPVGTLDTAPVTFSGEVYNYLLSCP